MANREQEDRSPTGQLSIYSIIVLRMLLWMCTALICVSIAAITGFWTHRRVGIFSIPLATPSTSYSSIAIVITGVHSSVNFTTGERPSRREFRDFEHSGPAFDLYIQCQAEFMEREQTNALSYYEVAGMAMPSIVHCSIILTIIYQLFTKRRIDHGTI